MISFPSKDGDTLSPIKILFFFAYHSINRKQTNIQNAPLYLISLINENFITKLINQYYVTILQIQVSTETVR